jgi:hypothetical protein
VNFTAEPVSKLYQQTFYCGVSQLYDGFSGYCNRYTTGFDDVTLKFATTGSSRAYLIKDRTVHTVAENGYATAFLNLSSWIGGLPATGSFSIQYKLKTELSTSRIKSYTAQLLHRYEQRREVRRRIYILHIRCKRDNSSMSLFCILRLQHQLYFCAVLLSVAAY